MPWAVHPSSRSRQNYSKETCRTHSVDSDVPVHDYQSALHGRPISVLASEHSQKGSIQSVGVLYRFAGTKPLIF